MVGLSGVESKVREERVAAARSFIGA